MAFSLTWNTTGYDFTEEVEQLDWDDPTNIPTELVPRRHGALVTEQPVLGPRMIHLYGAIVKATAALAETQLNTLVVQMNSGRGQLSFNGSRYINCYKQDMNFTPSEGGGLAVIRYRIDFFCDDPFWYAATATSSDQAVTYNPTSWAHSNGGDALVYPVVSVIAGGSPVSGGVTITNSTTGKSFTYSATISAGQTLAVDCGNFTVLNNGVSDLASWSGTFIWLQSGSNSMLYAGSNCTVRIAYTQRFYGPAWT